MRIASHTWKKHIFPGTNRFILLFVLHTQNHRCHHTFHYYFLFCKPQQILIVSRVVVLLCARKTGRKSFFLCELLLPTFFIMKQSRKGFYESITPPKKIYLWLLPLHFIPFFLSIQAIYIIPLYPPSFHFSLFADIFFFVFCMFSCVCVCMNPFPLWLPSSWACRSCSHIFHAHRYSFFVEKNNGCNIFPRRCSNSILISVWSWWAFFYIFYKTTDKMLDTQYQIDCFCWLKCNQLTIFRATLVLPMWDRNTVALSLLFFFLH